MRRGGVAVERQRDGIWRIPPDYLDQALEVETRVAKATRVKLQLLAVQDLDCDSTANAPSWLDGQLRLEEQTEIAKHGYGANVRQAMVRRQKWLIEQGLAERRERSASTRRFCLSKELAG